MTPVIRKIVVPTDFSAASDKALEYAATLATTLNASIHLVHVVEDPFAAGGGWEFYIPDSQDLSERLFEQSLARLSITASEFDSRNIDVTTEIRRGSPTEGIISAATDSGADLIVMSTHGRTGLPHLLLGSVAERVIRGARCPVLAVRESKTEERVPAPMTVTTAA
jgi:nucleotide-binding universal stress UspA family protein